MKPDHGKRIAYHPKRSASPSSHGHPQRKAGLRSPETPGQHPDRAKPQGRCVPLRDLHRLRPNRNLENLGLPEHKTLLRRHDPGAGATANHRFGEELDYGAAVKHYGHNLRCCLISCLNFRHQLTLA